MATRLQKVLQAPVLLSLATLYPEGFSSKRVGDIPELAERLKNAVVKAGLELRWNDFKNEVEWRTAATHQGRIFCRPKLRVVGSHRLWSYAPSRNRDASPSRTASRTS